MRRRAFLKGALTAPLIIPFAARDANARLILNQLTGPNARPAPVTPGDPVTIVGPLTVSSDTAGTVANNWSRSQYAPSGSGVYQQVRALIRAGTGGALNINSASISWQSSGADSTAVPIELTFDDGSTGTTIAAGQDKWSDWVYFDVDFSSLPGTGELLVHQDYDSAGFTRRAVTGANTFYFGTTGYPAYLTQDVTEDGSTNNAHGVFEIQARTMS